GVAAVAFTAGGRQCVSAGSDQSCRIWDVQTGQVLARRPAGRMEHGLGGFSADGSRCVAVADLYRPDAALVVHDTRTGGQLARRPMAFQRWTALALSPDGRLVAAGGEVTKDRAEVHLWDVERNEARQLWRGSGLQCLAF